MIAWLANVVRISKYISNYLTHKGMQYLIYHVILIDI